MKKSIEQFINIDYKNYAKYVAFKRALPSVIDGFKPIRRKIFYYILQNKNKGFIRVSAIAGGLSERCNYHHAEASAQGTIVNITKDFPSTNNIPILRAKGAFGSKILPKSAGAPRYIQAAYNPMMDFIFLDNDLLLADDDIENPEPKYYYPIIPMFLVNGISGIGIGYANNILPRNPIKIIDMIKSYLNGREIEEALPYYRDCKYIVEKVGDKSFQISGTIDHTDTDKIVITETIPNMDRNKMIANLLLLEENEKIKSFKDESKEDWNIKVSFHKQKPTNLFKLFNIQHTYHENYTLLDMDNNIRVFKSISEIIKYFVDFRLTIYTERKRLEVEKLEKLIQINNAMIAISDIIKELNKISEVDIFEALKDQFAKSIIKYCLSKPINTFFRTNKTKLTKEISEYKKQISYYNKTDIKRLYMNDLDKLQKEIKNVYSA